MNPLIAVTGDRLVGVRLACSLLTSRSDCYYDVTLTCIRAYVLCIELSFLDFKFSLQGNAKLHFFLKMKFQDFKLFLFNAKFINIQ